MAGALPDHLCRGLVERLVHKKKAYVEHFAVLTPSRFLLYRISEEWVQNQPPQLDIYVPAIISLEDVTEHYATPRRANAFQIILSEQTTDDRTQHVFTASSRGDFALWLDCIGKARLTNEVWLLWFHPGTFDDRWSCCKKVTAEEGCQPTTNCAYPNKEDPAFRRQCHAAFFRGYQTVLTRAVRLAGHALNRGEAVTVVNLDAVCGANVIVTSSASSHLHGPLGRDCLRMGDIREESWFFQELPPTIATALLQCMSSGTFLVRSFRRRLALSLVVEDTVRHHWIHQDDKALCYVESDFRFSNIQEMVLFYSKHARLGHRLNQFPKRENLEKLWHLDKKQLELKTEMYSQHLPYATFSGTYGPVPILGVSSRPKQIRAEVEVLRKTARMLMCLDHQNIVKLIGVHHEDPDFTLVLEDVPPLLSFIAGYGLQRLLHEWEILVTITHNLATALLYLHRKGIVHNEVVVENCFLHTDTFTAKLGNFQYARFEDCRPDSVQEELLHRHSRLLLAPPETSRQGQVASCQTDVWAFGILLWVLFHSGGQTTPVASVHQLLADRWSNLMPELATVIGQLVYSCVHEVPQLRISTYELAKQLRSLLELRKHLKRVQSRPHSQPGFMLEQRTTSTPHIHTSVSSTEMATIGASSVHSPNLTVKAKKKRRFLRSYGRKHHSSSTASNGGDSPASTTASSLENVQFPHQHHSRSQSTSPASGLLRGLRGIFGGGSAARGTLDSSSSPSGAADLTNRGIPASGDCNSDSAMSSLTHSSPMVKTTSFSGVSLRADGGRGSDSNDTLSWDGWAPDMVAGGPVDQHSDLQVQYDQLREYCRSLLVKLKRERRERIRVAGELSRTREDLECRIMETETARRQLAKEGAVQQRASEEKVRQLQSTIVDLENELAKRPPAAAGGEAEQSRSRDSRDEAKEVEQLRDALRKAELRLSAYEALTSKLQSQLYTGSVPQPPNGMAVTSSSAARDVSPPPVVAPRLRATVNSTTPSASSLANHRTELKYSPSPTNHRAEMKSPSTAANHRVDLYGNSVNNDRVNGFESPLSPKRTRHPVPDLNLSKRLSHPAMSPGPDFRVPPRPSKPPPAPPHRTDSIGRGVFTPRATMPHSHVRTPSSDTSASSGPRPTAFSRSASYTRPSDSSSPGSPARPPTNSASNGNNNNHDKSNAADIMNTLV